MYRILFKRVPKDDLDDQILGRMIKEAGVFYELVKKSPQI